MTISDNKLEILLQEVQRQKIQLICLKQDYEKSIRELREHNRKSIRCLNELLKKVFPERFEFGNDDI